MAAPAPVAQTSPRLEGGTLRPHAREVVALLRDAGEHGLDPADYPADEITRTLAQGDDARADRLLSAAFAAYARDLTVPQGDQDVIYVDPELRPAAPLNLAIDAGLAERLRALHANNPLYEARRVALARYRRDWSGLPQVLIPDGPPLAVGSRGARVALLRQRLGLAEPTSAADRERFDAALGEAVARFRAAHGLPPRPVADRATLAALNRGAAHYEDLLIADMDRLRGLPREGRYLLVDTAGAMLRLIEGGREVDAMRVVVGKPGMETPRLAAFVRYAVVNPYWNVPPDLVRSSIAPAVLREGETALDRRNYVLSANWQSHARVDPDEVDWPAVAAGRESIWVRQLPGGANMMGAVKFMLPNDLGIYLHDTPDKSLFARADRRLSSGCVRLEDAPRLARWLFGRAILDGDPAPDRRFDLPRPVPVFITSLAVDAENGALRFRP